MTYNLTTILSPDLLYCEGILPHIPISSKGTAPSSLRGKSSDVDNNDDM